MRHQFQNPIEFISGATNILLIAPHGHHLDDEKTGELTRLVAEQNGCYAIINEYYGKKLAGSRRINLNDLMQVKKHLQDEFLNPLLEYKNKMVEEYGSAWIFWIHGAEQASIKNDANGRNDINPDEIKVLVGYGQKTDNDRLTAEPETAAQLIESLTQHDLKAVAANPDIPQGTKSFCGHDRNNMNQLFRAGEYRDENVQSFQLEFRKLGCRDTAKNIEETAHKLVKAISTLLPVVVVESKSILDDEDDDKVEKAYEHLKKIFVKHLQKAMLQCGQYLIETFYGGKYELAQKKKFTSNKSLAKLIKRIQEDATEKGDAPSRTWLYDAVNLAIDNHLCEQKKLPSVYGQLGHSHKVNLTSAPDEVKPTLVQETFEKQYTVAKLRERIREEKDKLNPDRLSLKKAMSIKKLGTLKPKQLKALKAKTEALVKKVQNEAKLYQGNLELIEQVLKEK